MSETETTVKITVDGREVEATDGELVIAAVERAGTYIPRFCWHPRMNPVGMCRMCIVEIDTGRGPALQPSCMVSVAEGMTVLTDSDVTKKAQDGVLEFLLANHPLDCPVCDKGGECPLQDQAYAYGPGESRFVEEKRHFEKPIPISDLVALDRERCILCDRCTRFSKEVAGDTLIHFQDRGNQTQVNTFPDHPFASYFSGNTVQICPVGALTAEPYRFKARPWDLDQVESTCTSCAVGCRVAVQATRNEIVRNQGVDIDGVNWGWLCDKGRFDFEAIHSDDRLTGPLARTGEAHEPISWSEALDRAAGSIRSALDSAGPGGVGVIGGARLTNEAAYAWAKLAKGVIGTDNVDCQLGDGLPADLVLGVPKATIDDACRPGGTVVLLGVDPKEELPVLYLRLRHAVVEDGATLIEIAPQTSGLTEVAAHSLVHGPGAEAAVVAALLAEQPGAVAGCEADVVAAAASALGRGPVTVIVGRGNLASGPEGTAAAVGVLLDGLPEVSFLTALRRGNTHGALDAGLAPGILPGRVGLDEGRSHFHETWSTVPATVGLDTAGILNAAADGKLDVLVLLGADPLADFPDHDLARRALAGARTVVAVDTVLSPSAKQADVVLAAAGWAEVSGTTTNLEGRVSNVTQKVTPPGTARPDWMLAAELADRLGDDLGFTDVAGIFAELTTVAPAYAGLEADAIAHEGQVAVRPGTAAAPAGNEGSADESSEEPADENSAEETAAVDGADAAPEPEPASVWPDAVSFQAPRGEDAPAPDGYRLRLVTRRELYDAGTATAQSPSLAGLARGAIARLHPHDFDRLGVAQGGAVVVSNREGGRGAVTVPAVPSDAVPKGTVGLAFNQPGAAASVLVDAAAPVTDVRVEVAP